MGVVYGLGASGNQWAIQNIDNATMPIGDAFNVMVGAGKSNGGTAVLLTANSSNSFSAYTLINNSQTNGNPNTVVFETENADPGLHFGTNDKAPMGVIYRAAPAGDVEAVLHEDLTTMPTATHYFNLLIFPS